MSPVDPVAVARRVVDDPRRLLTVPTRDLMGICRALVEADQRPQITDGLAAAARALIAAGRSLADARRAVVSASRDPGLTAEIDAFNAAFAAFQAAFEEEFPDVHED